MDGPGAKESIVFGVDIVGGEENKVSTSKPNPFTLGDYKENGYARYIEEIRNVIKFLKQVLGFFLESVSDLPNSPIDFIEKLSVADLVESIKKMRTSCKEIYDNHKDGINKALEEERQAHQTALSKSSSSSSGSSSSSTKLLLKVSVAAATGFDPEAATGFDPEAGSHGRIPANIFMRKLQNGIGVMKTGYNHLKAKMGGMLINAMRALREEKPKNLKEYALQNMERLTKWKYYLRALENIADGLNKDLQGLRLDADECVRGKTSLSEFAHCNPFKASENHHNLLITQELTSIIAEISELQRKQFKKWVKMREGLKTPLPLVSKDLEAKVVQWTAEILSESKFHDPLSESRLQKPKQPLKKLKSSTESQEHLCDTPE